MAVMEGQKREMEVRRHDRKWRNVIPTQGRRRVMNTRPRTTRERRHVTAHADETETSTTTVSPRNQRGWPLLKEAVQIRWSLDESATVADGGRWSAAYGGRWQSAAVHSGINSEGSGLSWVLGRDFRSL
ncbi:hypothetical protein LR48_Vigan511s009300 [Vigna angularis]|uniref:Uncharacterized protein n=1 Tax=Phaseolus angularis TaxID=3914 RepID=A0A0L9TCC8_PHAAN|nr:hypothetical protein LR48_Vigan511s009300 [Vigna angularis]